MRRAVQGHKSRTSAKTKGFRNNLVCSAMSKKDGREMAREEAGGGRERPALGTLVFIPWEKVAH